MFQAIHNFVIVLTKTEDVLHWNAKRNVPLTVGDWMRYACLAANPLLSALLQLLLCLYTTIDYGPEPLKSHLGILADQAWYLPDRDS